MKKLTTMFILFLVISSILSAKDMIEPMTKGNPEGENKILITGSWSDFKATVFDKLIEKYGENTLFEFVEYDTFKEKNHDEYDALIINDQNEAWMLFNNKTKKLIRKSDNPEKIILFITAGDPDWTWKDDDTGIEAVTSASEEPKEAEVVQQISERLDKLLK